MTSPGNHPPVLPRLATGVPGLDDVLSGGLVRGGVYMVFGRPGAGKTILANQACFHHAAQGGRVLYVTLMAETHARMLANLRTLTFFDASAIPERLTYLSAFTQLEEGGLHGLLEVLRKEVRKSGATLLVLDGLVSAQESAGSSRDFKKFIHELQVITGFADCTTLLLTSGSGDQLKAEHTMVDGLLLLRERVFGARPLRELTVRKFRGSGHLRGRHVYSISSSGITLYPRLEEVLPSTLGVDARPGRERRRFGVPGLDEMLHGGLLEGSPTLLYGTTGAGKTLLGLHFLAEGARRGERSHFFGFYEPPGHVLAQARAVGLDLEPLVEQGLLELSFRAPGENVLDALAHELLEAVQQRGVKRMFIDGLDGLMRAAERPARLPRLMAALVNAYRAAGASLLYTAETPSHFSPELPYPPTSVSLLTENVLLLRCTELRASTARAIAVLKMRGTGFDHAVRTLEIGDDGLRVGEPFADVEAVLTGVARATPPTPKRKRRVLRRGRG